MQTQESGTEKTRQKTKRFRRQRFQAKVISVRQQGFAFLSLAIRSFVARRNVNDTSVQYDTVYVYLLLAPKFKGGGTVSDDGGGEFVYY